MINTDTVWVLVDGEMITGTALSRTEARALRASGYRGTIRKALITLV